MAAIEIHTSNEESEGTENLDKLPGESKISEELPATRHDDVPEERLMTAIKINQ